MQSIRRGIGTRTPVNAGVTVSGGISGGTAYIDMDSDEGSFSKFRAYAYSDVAGTLNVQQAPDDGTGNPDAAKWGTSKSEPIPAGGAVGVEVESLCVRRFVRWQVVNGGTNQATLHVDFAKVAV